MKKKIVIPGIFIFALIIGIFAFAALPRNIINETADYSIYRITYLGEDVTDLVDRNAISEAVSRYKCSRLPHAFAPYQLSQVVVELNGVNGNSGLNIILGDINIAYQSANKGGFSILNSSALLNEIVSLIKTT